MFLGRGEEADQISQPLNPLASVSEHDSPFPLYPPRDITQFHPTAPFSGNSPVKQIKRKRTSTLCPLPSGQTVPFARGNRRKRDKNDHFYFVDYLFQPIENCYRSPHSTPLLPRPPRSQRCVDVNPAARPPFHFATKASNYKTNGVNIRPN